MDLKTYFENTRGTGMLATADDAGKVDIAVYSRPHILEDGKMALIMRDRLSHHNLQSNPHAAYLFIEASPGYQGKRFFLTKIAEEEGGERLEEFRRRRPDPEKDVEKGGKLLVTFQIDRELPLIGSGEA